MREQVDPVRLRRTVLLMPILMKGQAVRYYAGLIPLEYVALAAWPRRRYGIVEAQCSCFGAALPWAWMRQRLPYACGLWGTILVVTVLIVHPLITLPAYYRSLELAGQTNCRTLHWSRPLAYTRRATWLVLVAPEPTETPATMASRSCSCSVRRLVLTTSGSAHTAGPRVEDAVDSLRVRVTEGG